MANLREEFYTLRTLILHLPVLPYCCMFVSFSCRIYLCICLIVLYFILKLEHRLRLL